MKKKIFLLVFSLLCAEILNAAILNVPADYATIQAGINAATTHDTVLVDTGTYVENINYNGKNITVASLFLTTQDTTYISQTVIDGNENGSVVTFENGEDETAVLLGFTITEGRGKHFIIEEEPGIFWDEYRGGAIYCDNSNPEINFLKIFNNEANLGGGFYCINSNPIIKNLKISNNHAQTGEWIWADGGGLYCKYSNLVIENIELYNNSAVGSGGGIYCSHYSNISIENFSSYNNIASSGGALYFILSDAQLSNCHIFNNSTSNRGGGITCRNNCNLTLTNVSINSNNAEEKGGGVFCAWDSNLNLINTIVSNNIAQQEGGGIYCNDDSSTSLQNVTISGNSAYYGGGIYCITSSSPSLQNVTISSNSANCDGGGIWCGNSSDTDLVNCILWNNSPEEIYFCEDYNPNTITISYSDIQGGEEGIVTNNNGTVNWLDGNIDADPLFADTLNEDYHLTQDSPCVDAGTPDTTGLHLPPWDLDGNIRIWDGNGNGVAVIDMGAYEFGSPIYSIHEPVIPEESIIYNFPNPTKNSTTILYSLKKNSHVMISIYNIKGQLVTTLVNESKSQGEYSVEFETKALSSGVYFYKMQTEDGSEIKKMIVIK